LGIRKTIGVGPTATKDNNRIVGLTIRREKVRNEKPREELGARETVL